MVVIAMKVSGFSVLFVCLMFLAEKAAGGGVLGSQLLGNEKRTGGVRMELHHRDKLAASKADIFTRIHQAVQRSKLRAKYLAFKARALATSNASRHLADFITPVSSGQGEYLMQLQLGTPVISFHAIVDTGSDLVWVQCQPCLRCYQTDDPIFNPLSSSSYSLLSCNSQPCQALGSNAFCGVINCKYDYHYGDGSSTTGDFSTETITMSDVTSGGSIAISPVAFGCGHNNQGSFSANTGGLVGLGRGPISFISQLSHLIQEQFSYCLVSFGDTSTITSPLFFGSAATLSGSRIGITPILNAAVPTFYYVGITGIDVGGSPLGIPSSSFDSSSAGTIIDSGTTITYFEDQAYSIVKSAFSKKVPLRTVDGSQYGLDLCYDISSQPSFQPPSFTIHFLGASLSPPAANYFVLVDTNVLCLAILSAGTSGNPSILGNILQQNYHILYDIANSHISFQQAQCDAL